MHPGRALDIATGFGRNARLLARHGWTVDAIDISRTALERAQSRSADDGHTDSSSINWILADVDTYCFRPSSYDLITISFFDARPHLPAILEALTPGGVLVYEHYLRHDNEGDGNSSAHTDRFGSSDEDGDYDSSDGAGDYDSSDCAGDHDSSKRTHRSAPGDRYRFRPNELLEACSPLRIRFYDERPIHGERRVVLVGERLESEPE